MTLDRAVHQLVAGRRLAIFYKNQKNRPTTRKWFWGIQKYLSFLYLRPGRNIVEYLATFLIPPMDLDLVLKLPDKVAEGYWWFCTCDPHKNNDQWFSMPSNDGLLVFLSWGEKIWKLNINVHPVWGRSKLTTGMLKSTTRIGFWRHTLHSVPWYYGVWLENIIEPPLIYCMF